MILNLMSLYRYYQTDEQLYAKMIFNMIKDTACGQLEFFNRCLNPRRELDQKINKLVREIAEREGVVLPVF